LTNTEAPKGTDRSIHSAQDLDWVADIEALGSGTRVFDYATLLHQQQADDDAVRLLVDASGRCGWLATPPSPIAYAT
jgi:hypothetical protein